MQNVGFLSSTTFISGGKYGGGKAGDGGGCRVKKFQIHKIFINIEMLKNYDPIHSPWYGAC
jgi:hypothetical protein